MEILRTLLKKQLTIGVRRSLRQLRGELLLQRRHRSAVKKAHRLQPPLKLHLGCGNNLKRGWVNIDLFEPEADLCLDVREPLPFGSDSVEIIFSEHLFEHLEYPDEVFRLLRECHRVLRANGIFCVGVPDAAPLLEHYVAHDTDFFTGTWDPNYPAWLALPMHRINYLFHQFGDHKYAYDEQILIQTLREAGFCDVERSSAFPPELDAEVLRGGTLCVNATKTCGARNHGQCRDRESSG